MRWASLRNLREHLTKLCRDLSRARAPSPGLLGSACYYIDGREKCVGRYRAC